MTQPSKNIIERKSKEGGILDFNTAPNDNKKLYVCKLVIDEMSNILFQYVPRKLPQKSLEEYEEAINRIIGVFKELQETPSIGNKFRISGIMPLIEDALSHLSHALEIKGIADKAHDYSQHIQDCRDKLREAKRQLDAMMPPPSPT